MAVLVPSTVSQSHSTTVTGLVLQEPEPQTRTFPNPGVLDLPEFWFS